MNRLVFIIPWVLLHVGLTAAPNFGGTWATSFGRMLLVQNKQEVGGVYLMEDVLCYINGQVRDGQLVFTYRESDIKGEGQFKLTEDGVKFTGRWRPVGAAAWSVWEGARVQSSKSDKSRWHGQWATTFGRMRLTEKGDKVEGIYAYGSASTILGKTENGRLNFHYQESDVKGQGWFEISAQGRLFYGKWKPEGSDGWSDWGGTRTINKVDPNRKWLVVLEAHWEDGLEEPEYSFGKMLKTFFSRVPKVQVRHRYFHDEEDLARWCREVAFMEGPVLLCIASHGSAKGVTVGGKTIRPETIARHLSYADNVVLTHFSACNVVQAGFSESWSKGSQKRRIFPVSGYGKTVDWAVSAVIEFMYFDMILSRGLSPKKAWEHLRQSMPFVDRVAGKTNPIQPAGFKFVEPANAIISNGKTTIKSSNRK